MLAAIPTAATASISGVATSVGSRNRSTAWINTQTATPTSSRALANAASTSARCSPNVRRAVASRVASEAATSAMTNPVESVSMWPASASSANEPDSRPPTTSATNTAPVMTSTIRSRRRC